METERPVLPAGGVPSRAGASGAALDLINVAKNYGTLCAVSRVDLKVAPGEFVTLLGPSGSGKTTILNMIAGFIRPTAGEILMDERSIADDPPHKRDIGVVFQDYALFPHMTVADNVAFPLRRRRVDRAEQKTRVAQALEMVGLEEKAGTYPRHLSGGQQQRVALARALVFEPRVLLMDEPLGALDRNLREWLQMEIKRIHNELGITFLYVTHDQEEALVLSDRIAVFNEGVIDQCGTGQELYEEPRSLFVANFLGESNVFTGRAGRTSSGWSLDSGDHRFIAPSPPDGEPQGAALRPGDRVALVIRPEQIRLSRPGASEVREGENRVRGRVRTVIYLGSERKIELGLPDGKRLIVREKGGGSMIELSEDEELNASWSPARSTLLPNGLDPAQAAGGVAPGRLVDS